MRADPLLPLLCLTLVASLPLAGQAGTTAMEPVDLGDPAWRLSGDVVQDTLDGRPVLRMRTGTAARPDLDFSDGTIEFEMMGTDTRSFLGLVFRAGDERHGEDVYFRRHKSLLPDAVQYTPDYRGRGQWQLYHGPDATAGAHIPAGVWQRVRVEVRGGQAAVFLGSADGPPPAEPVLLIPRLRTGRERGFIGLWANQPGAGADAPWTATLAGLSIAHGETRYRFTHVEPERPPTGAIPAWGVSQPFVRAGDDVLALPAVAMEGAWRAQGAEPSGLLPFDRHVVRPDDGVPAILAGLVLEADSARTVRLDLGFSDDASVFLNGRLLYSGRFWFSSNFPRRQGLITLEQASLYLPLAAGENELVVAVAESGSSGGWGISGRIADRRGLAVRPLNGAR